MKGRVLFLLGLFFVVALGVLLYSFFTPLKLKGPLYFEIKEGMSFRKALDALEEKGLIRERLPLYIYAKLTRIDRKLKYGIYFFNGTITPYRVLKDITEGRVYLREVTVPEGYNIWQIAELLQKKGIVDKERFLNKAKDGDFLKSLGIKGPTAEGYLFPDTYSFALKSPPEVVIKKMVENLRRHFTEEMKERASQMGLSELEVLTLASMIEKEARVPEERPIISGVFYNRLKRHMPLASDPTTVYGIKPISEGITKADLKRRHPYNTYLRIGLPPGPICSPGLGSIKAALYPARVPYLYFVSKGDGTHYFSVNLRDHLRAIRRYRAWH